MRRRARVDANQAQIVQSLRRAGATVQSLAEVGRGCPDIIVGCQRPCPHCGHRFPQNLLLEIKDGDKPPSARQLTPDEKIWHGQWVGQADVILRPEAALLVMGATPKG